MRTHAVLPLAIALLATPPGVHAQQAGDLTFDTKILAVSGREVQVDTGHLWVPEYRADPASPLIRIAFARMRTTAATPLPPVFYLEGGPGGSSTWMANDADAAARWLPYLDLADVVLVDQRGTGQSDRSLRFRAESIPNEVFLDAEVALGQFVETTRAAAEHFRAEGVRLEGYTSAEAADDLNDLRAALGYDQMTLLGFSYGTHLAQATIKRHEVHVANAVLAGVEGLDETHKLPLNMDRQFAKLARMVADDPVVGPRIPDLVALYDRVIAKLEREPILVSIPERPEPIPVGPWGLQFILRFDMGDARDLPVFPRLLHSIDQGDPSVLAWFVRRRGPVFMGVNLMGTLTDGASGASPERWTAIHAQAARSRFGYAMVAPWPWADSVTGVVDLGQEYRAPLVSDVPALLLSGSLDWNCPPYQAERLRWGMRNATHISVENAGHEQILPQPGIQEAILRFLQGDDVSDVHVALPALRFVPLEGTDSEVWHPAVGPRGG
jgi:pimeloyl-ACP methyl ester carboxylesterase